MRNFGCTASWQNSRTHIGRRRVFYFPDHGGDSLRRDFRAANGWPRLGFLPQQLLRDDRGMDAICSFVAPLIRSHNGVSTKLLFCLIWRLVCWLVRRLGSVFYFRALSTSCWTRGYTLVSFILLDRPPFFKVCIVHLVFLLLGVALFVCCAVQL